MNFEYLRLEAVFRRSRLCIFFYYRCTHRCVYLLFIYYVNDSVDSERGLAVKAARVRLRCFCIDVVVVLANANAGNGDAFGRLLQFGHVLSCGESVFGFGSLPGINYPDRWKQGTMGLAFPL